MWAGLFIGILYAQYNVAMIAPMLGMDMKFPTSNFGVGRGFPLVQTANKNAPWISLNRLFFPESKFAQALQEAEPKILYTNDKSKGQLALAHRPDGKWAISGTAWFDPTASVYAETKGPASQQLLDGLRESSWNVGGKDTRMGVRSGKELRDKLFDFAKERQLGIGQIYMVDGSYKDARANAFVTGAGNHSIIGLYDTLFLGQRGSDAEEDTGDEDDVQELAESKSLIQHASEVVQGVDLEEEDQDKRKPRNSAPTQAMNDDEIVAILAHELAHAGLKHMEMGMAAQVATSFATFGALGWMSHSPLAAVALGLAHPVLHVGACAYDHVVGPFVEGFMKLFTDGLTRHNEYEADAYAALISEKYGTGLQTALAKLSVNSNQDPDPPFFYEALHADHPPFAKRWAHIEEVKKKAYGQKTQPAQMEDKSQMTQKK
jgi:Zn-dependent protease with chaperone function